MAELGKITPKKMYQTTDGKKFEDSEEAFIHQTKINIRKTIFNESRIPAEIKDMFLIQYGDREVSLDTVTRLQFRKGTVIIDVNFATSTMDVTVSQTSRMRMWTTLNRFKKAAVTTKKITRNHGGVKETVYTFKF